MANTQSAAKKAPARLRLKRPSKCPDFPIGRYFRSRYIFSLLSKLPASQLLQHGRWPIPAALPLALLLWLCPPTSIWGDDLGSQSPAAPATTVRKQTQARPFQTKVVRGRVVWLAEALERRYGIASVPDAAERALAVETPQGELRLLVEDARGHAFRADERLRKLDLKLLVRQYESSPVLQVVRVFEVVDGVDFEIDYWCQICAIAMYELKACDCCQGPIELRKRRQTVPLGDLKHRPETK